MESVVWRQGGDRWSPFHLLHPPITTLQNLCGKGSSPLLKIKSLAGCVSLTVNVVCAMVVGGKSVFLDDTGRGAWKLFDVIYPSLTLSLLLCCDHHHKLLDPLV